LQKGLWRAKIALIRLDSAVNAIVVDVVGGNAVLAVEGNLCGECEGVGFEAVFAVMRYECRVRGERDLHLTVMTLI
jgi:hypothetical protein